MVNAIAADPSISRRDAAKAAAQGIPGTLLTHAERIRKRYRQLEKQGQLPTPTTPLSKKIDEVKALYAERSSWLEESKQTLAVATAQAERLNLDISPEHLPVLIRELQAEKDRFDRLLHSQATYAFSELLQQGIRDPAQAEAYLAEAPAKQREAEERLKLLQAISTLRERLS